MGPRLILLAIVAAFVLSGCTPQETPGQPENPNPSKKADETKTDSGEKVESGGQLGVNPNYKGG